jgi:protein gp37
MVDGKAQWTGEVRVFPEMLDWPRRWKQPRTIFVGSRFDLFHKAVPWDFVDQVFRVMADCPEHTFLILTKRAEIAWWFRAKGRWAFGDNLWVGITAENQARLVERWEVLRLIPGNKWLSLEPLLGPVDLSEILYSDIVCSGCGKALDWLGQIHDEFCDGLQSPPTYCGEGMLCTAEPNGQLGAVIVGGESGPGARPMQLDWVRAIRDQCAVAGVPFFFKQWGEWRQADSWRECVTNKSGHRYDHRNVSVDGVVRNVYDKDLVWLGASIGDPPLLRVGKKAAGRLLDRRQHNDLPWRVR